MELHFQVGTARVRSRTGKHSASRRNASIDRNGYDHIASASADCREFDIANRNIKASIDRNEFDHIASANPDCRELDIADRNVAKKTVAVRRWHRE